MSKRTLIAGITVVLAATIAIAIYLLTSPKTLGNITHSYSEPTTTTSNISFSGEAGDKIKFSFKSHVEAGSLDMVLYDSGGIKVYELDNAKALETFFDLPHSGTYTLTAECDSFIGDFEIKVYNIT